MHGLRAPLLAAALALPALIATPQPSGPQTESPPDYSHAGYGGGGVPLPRVETRLTLAPTGSDDDTPALQSALDQLSALPPDAQGFRGALLLRPGTYRIAGQLRLTTPGTVLRGDRATLLATGPSRRTLLRIKGSNPNVCGPAVPPAPGATVLLRRPSTITWIQSLGMDAFKGNYANQRLHWLPGTRDLVSRHTVTALDPLTLTPPVPFADAAPPEPASPLPLHHIGVENLTLDSEHDPANPRDEEHAWIAIQLDHVENAWLRGITARHFVSAAIWTTADTRAITIQDCHSEAPVGEDAGWRRFAYYIGGQQTLVQRCTADAARHPFLAGHCSPGPNVFLDCTATRATGDSGSIESWANALLLDHVAITGGGITLGNHGPRWQGAGWNAAHSTAFNCTADKISVAAPNHHTHSNASSLYRTQLAARLGEKSLAALAPSKIENPKSEVPPATVPTPKPETPNSDPSPLAVSHGHLVLNGRAVLGTGTANAWWKGSPIPARAAQLGWSATRWTPGREGPGLTENLADLAAQCAAQHHVLVHVWPGLWYDRRRDDHTTATRDDPEAWPPYYEQPWARTGPGAAADGLGKYDLTRFNPWYWNRLREFADALAPRGLVLYHHLYNHHNLIEAAAHWADFPWRPANNINDTSLTEPPPWRKNGREINVVAEFYDITHPARRELHRRLIRHSLDQLAGKPNVIHTLGFQFAGPLAFQQFYLDTVAEWQTGHPGATVRLALNTSKTITDAILADPVRSRLIHVIDQRYWQYLADGTLFAPHSDGATAFRDDRIAAFGKDAVPPCPPERVYQQVREYRDRHPDKAVFAYHAGQGALPVLMAGGALPLLADYAAAQPLKPERDERVLFAILREHLATALPRMRPDDTLAENAWALADAESRHLLLFPITPHPIRLRQPLPPSASLLWIELETGHTQPLPFPTEKLIHKPTQSNGLVLIKTM